MPANLAVACSTLPNLLTVTKIRERVNPASSAYMVTAADGHDYVMKFFPQRYASFCARSEVFTNAIGRRLGLSMAHWRTLQVDDQTVTDFRADNQEQEGEMSDLCSGVHFGSLYRGSREDLVGYIPQPLLWRNMDVARQLGCIRLFDVWIGNSGFRQSATCFQDGYPQYVYFFGHAHVFQAEAREPDNERACKAYAAACRIAGSPDPVHSFIAALAALTRVDLYQAFNDVPAFWRHQVSEIQAIAFLERRRDWLRSLARVGFNPDAAKVLFSPGLMCDTERNGSWRSQAGLA